MRDARVPSRVRRRLRPSADTLGARCYQHHLGRRPAGMWLPECGFVPGIDRVLADEGVNYFLVDSHALELADPPPVFGTYAPVVCPSGVFAFARDPESSAQVWSAEAGYPGDPRYREFYRDIGHDLDSASIARFLLPGGVRRNLGLKYHRVTGRDVPLHEKKPYHRAWALEAANEHAEHFVHARARRIHEVWTKTGRAPVIVAPYDAELFGHWWFEGPEFLDLVVRKSCTQSAYRLSTPSDVLDSGLEFQVAMPAASSWGAYGYSQTWLNSDNEWIWPHLHHATREMSRIARERPRAAGLTLRATQSARPGTCSRYRERLAVHDQHGNDGGLCGVPCTNAHQPLQPVARANTGRDDQRGLAVEDRSVRQHISIHQLPRLCRPTAAQRLASS